jgi:two-component system sensor histidine kinase ArlS
MTLKTRISIFVTNLFLVLYLVMAASVILLFSEFRAEEFQNRLRQKAISTIELLIEIKQADQNIIKNIDKQKADNLIDEKTLVFNKEFKLVYSSLYDSAYQWEADALKNLVEKKEFFKRRGDTETFGILYKYKNEDYYTMVSAVDTAGFRKLHYLTYVLFFSFLLFTLLAWFLTRTTVARLLKPLEQFLFKIKSINENNLGELIQVKSNNTELLILAQEFNLMLKRIDDSLQHQSEFTANASHELRTPIARIIVQLENKINEPSTTTADKIFFQKLVADASQISELIHSLLILSKNDKTIPSNEESNRLDEIIYDCIEKINTIYPDCKVYFDIEIENEQDDIIELRGTKSLLEIVFINLIKNAYSYSDNKEVHIKIIQKENTINCHVLNSGKTINTEDQKRLFEPFMRGQNANGISGFGLGLRIVERILHIQKATIQYHSVGDNLNEFILVFPI